MFLKRFFIRAVSVGVHSDLRAGKKFAIQVTNIDIYGSLAAFGAYCWLTWHKQQYTLFFCNLLCSLLILLSLYLIHKKRYDLGRILIHQIGLFGIFYANDSYGIYSGFEYYYFVSIMMPNIVFSLDELGKAIPLSISAAILFVLHQSLGSGLFFTPVPAPPNERLIALFIVTIFTVIVLAVVRWRLVEAQDEIKKQHDELIHSSNLIALGEMSGGIAHEINNPLQSLSLQIMVIREKCKDVAEFPKDVFQHLKVMDDTILKMGKMVKGLKDLTRKDSPMEHEKFHFSKALEDVLIISSERLKEANIALYIYGDSDLALLGNSVQISQVFINLLNNAIDAVKHLKEKWIRIEVSEKNSFLQIAVTDSGQGISEDISDKMMRPFYTTKDPSQGTGLGLSISKSLVEKNKGRLYYDSLSANTRFVVLLPIWTEEPAQ